MTTTAILLHPLATILSPSCRQKSTRGPLAALLFQLAREPSSITFRIIGSSTMIQLPPNHPTTPVSFLDVCMFLEAPWSCYSHLEHHLPRVIEGLPDVQLAPTFESCSDQSTPSSLTWGSPPEALEVAATALVAPRSGEEGDLESLFVLPSLFPSIPFDISSKEMGLCCGPNCMVIFVRFGMLGLDLDDLFSCLNEWLNGMSFENEIRSMMRMDVVEEWSRSCKAIHMN
ncbi:hypothetical protein CDL15_Pgr015688 [Punica granatum]|uniref:Uncharacterized protein n=1 Tax=Punica granatum TaxID=22663 RepID=A0A218XNX0_PUNGR|nr:hypothetical protein CDL15_Pgr015688 [Punica granatum]